MNFFSNIRILESATILITTMKFPHNSLLELLVLAHASFALAFVVASGWTTRRDHGPGAVFTNSCRANNTHGIATTVAVVCTGALPFVAATLAAITGAQAGPTESASDVVIDGSIGNSYIPDRKSVFLFFSSSSNHAGLQCAGPAR